MKKIIEFFKNRVVISIIGLIVVSLLIWFVGPAIKFGSNNYAPLGGEVARLATIMIIIVLWGLNNLRINLQEKKQNEGLVADLQSNQTSAHSIISEQQSEEIHVINERFAQALATLKKLKFKGGGSRKALYELPWYIIIGPPGSGKTTALVNSSLEFPLAEKFGKEALQGVGGTRNCDWWFTNEAVLIDTAGRYTTQDSHKVIDSNAWDGFLNLLKKHRRRRPINGAIVAISLQELLLQTEEERNAHARIIRSRIDELMDKLGIRFPIYLMFTKSDLISGFSEFFEDLTKDDREQVWGISLPNAPRVSESPDFEYLEDEYKSLVKRLYERVLSRVHQERDVARRGAIQGFPQQMETLMDIVLPFVRQTFVKNRYQYQPYLRGVYFSSGTQDGSPIDRLMSSVSVNFGFDRQAMPARFGMGKSFFLGQLFRQVIFPESELVGSNRKYESIILWSQRAGYIGLTALLIIMISVWAGSFTRNEMYMHEVESYTAGFNAEYKRFNKHSTELRDLLPMLDVLAKASKVYDEEDHPWLSSLGMYDSAVDSAADAAYETQLKQLFLPRLLKHMEKYLSRGHSGEDLYDNFRTYMMFKKVEHMDTVQVSEYFKARWEQELIGQATVRKQLQRHLTALLNLKLPPSKLNESMVATIRAQLLRVPVAHRVYSRIRANPKYAQRVNLLNEFGESVRTVYVSNENVTRNLTIPVLFTIQAYKDLNLSPESEIIASLAREKWVLSEDNNARIDFAKDDLDDIIKDVKKLYHAEYRSYWDKVYNALQVKPFENLRQANDVLLNIVDPVYSPFLSILQTGAANTTLTNQSVNNLADDKKDGATGKAMGFLASQVKLTSVDKQFRELNLLLRETKARPAQIHTVIQKVRQMQEFVNEMMIAPDPGKKAFEVAKMRYQSGSGNAITSLRVYAKSLPGPVNRWLQTLATETWKVILGSSHYYVNTEWNTQVHSACMNALANRYPFQTNATEEVTLFDFTEFFKPGGTMDKFTAEFVKPFVDTRRGWHNKGIDNFSLGLRSSALTQIKQAHNIKTVFFSENPAMPSLTFQLRPFNMNKNDARFSLDMGEKRIVYSHGPKFWSTLQWIGNNESNRVRLVFEDLSDQQHSITYEGPWAWFRLQDNAQLTRTAAKNIYRVVYSAADGNRSGTDLTGANLKHSIRYEIKAKSINNPFNKDLLGSFKCQNKI